jgi:glycosyltransferase involved in cell wall biosynthesis
MRALHVIPAVAQRYGGPSSVIGPMCQALAACGVEPLIATTDADGPGRLPVPVGEVTSWQGVPALFFKKDFSESFKYSHGLATWLRAHVSDFDVVHVHAVLSHAPLAAAAACRGAGVPYIVRPLGTIAPWSLGRKAWRKRALFALGATRMLRGAAAIHYTSDEEKSSTERALGLTSGVVIPLGIDRVFLSEPLVPMEERERDPYVLALSRLHPKKNLEALIESFVHVSRGGRDGWRLVIAGSGDAGYVSALERLVFALKAADRVTFTGWVDGEKKQELMRRASLFAMPSLHENFGVSLIEALAAGVPAIVSRQVDLADSVGAAGAGWLVDSNDESLRRGLAEALGSAAERRSRSRAARQLAQSFGWPAVGAELLQLYRRVTSAPLPRAADLQRQPDVEAVHR